MPKPKSETLAKRKSETRQLTQMVAVRFSPDDLATLKAEASRRKISVQQLLREAALSGLSAAS